MSTELDNAVVIDFPLRGGPWVAVTTPAHRIPSHGTDMLGQRFAYDLIKVDGRARIRAHPGNPVWGLVVGVRARDCYAWGQPVHSPFDGEVIAAVGGIAERGWIHPVREAVRLVWNALTFRPSRLPAILGNHVIVRNDAGVVLGLVHLVPGSVTVRPGQRIARGEIVGRVGHTGNSTMPHLHLQLMDSADPLTARGVPCAFAGYDVQRADGSWQPVRDGVPGRTERLRHGATEPG